MSPATLVKETSSIQSINWAPIEKAIAPHYAPVSDAVGRPAYPGLLLFKIH